MTLSWKQIESNQMKDNWNQLICSDTAASIANRIQNLHTEDENISYNTVRKAKLAGTFSSMNL